MKKSLLIITFSFFITFSFSQLNSKYFPKSVVQLNNKENSVLNQKTRTSKAKSDSMYLYASFEADTLELEDWTTIDGDGDGDNWVVDRIPLLPGTPGAYDGTKAVTSQCNGYIPNNWLISPAIDLSNATGMTIVEFFARSWAYVDEYKHHFSLKLSTTGNDTTDFQIILFDDEEMDLMMKWKKFVTDLSAYNGDTIYLAWQHHNSTEDLLVFMLDGISVKENDATDIAITKVLSPNNNGGCRLNNQEYPVISLYNWGSTPVINLPVSYLVPGGALIKENISDTIPPFSSFDYTFTTPIDFSTLGYYNAILFIANLPGDEYNTNNSMYTDVSNTDAKITAHIYKTFSPAAGWNLTNSTGTKIAEYDYNSYFIGYDTLDVCVIADDCYTMDFTGSYNTGWIEVFYNDTLVGGAQEPFNAMNGMTVGGIGDACLGLDLELTSISTNPYVLSGSVDIEGTMKNIGTDTITSVDLNYTIDGGSTYTDNIIDISISSANIYEFQHAISAELYGAGDYDIKMWISNVNGTTDEDNTNDTLSFTFYVSSASAAKRVLLEEFTGAWCGWCPDGAVIMNEMLENSSRVIGVALHNGDSMSFDDANTIMSSYAAGFPSGVVDRHLFTGLSSVALSRENWESAADLRLQQSTPLSIELSSEYDPATRIVSVDITANYTLGSSGDYRFNCYIVEDSVSGTGYGWDQSNSLNTQAGHPMAGLGNPVVGYMHRHVARAFLGGPWGTSGSIPSSVTAGQSISIQYTDTLDDRWNPDNISLIGMVVEYGSNTNERDIINVNEAHLGESTVSIRTIEKTARQISVYPNPAKDIVRIENVENAQIDLYTIYGRLVKHVPLAGHTQNINIKDLSRGTYIIRISDEKGITTKKLVVVK